MRKGRLKDRDWRAYTIIKDIFSYYGDKPDRYLTSVLNVHMDLLMVMYITDRLSREEYDMYTDHVVNANKAIVNRYTYR